MANQKPLYEDPEIRIDHHPNSHEDHLLYLLSKGEEINYLIQRGILKTLATTPRHEVEVIMRRVNETMVEDARCRGLTVDSLGYAIAQAYIEQEKRLDDLVAQMDHENI
jgi:hypothetical protein